MLEPEERQRRIVAARTLRNLTQKELDALGAEHGLGKVELSRLERGGLGERFTAAHAHALCRILRVPPTWFTEESVDVLVGYAEPLEVGEISRGASPSLVAEQIRRLVDVVAQVRGQAPAGSPPAGGGTDPPEIAPGGGGA